MYPSNRISGCRQYRGRWTCAEAWESRRGGIGRVEAAHSEGEGGLTEPVHADRYVTLQREADHVGVVERRVHGEEAGAKVQNAERVHVDIDTRRGKPRKGMPISG